MPLDLATAAEKQAALGKCGHVAIEQCPMLQTPSHEAGPNEPLHSMKMEDVTFLGQLECVRAYAVRSPGPDALKVQNRCCNNALLQRCECVA